jgi:uncharacterized membrane protein
MNRMIRSIRSSLGTALVLCVCALTLLGDTSAAFDTKESGGAEHQKRHPKHDGDVGLRGHGFVASNGVFTTIDAPGASVFTIAFGIDESGKTVGGYVDDRGRLHGFLRDKQAFTVIDFPGATATFAARINSQGQIVGAYSEEPNTPVLSLPHGFLWHDGVFTPIDVPGAIATQPFGINNRGQIVGLYIDDVGVHGFLLSNGTFTTITAPGAFQQSFS